MSIIWIDSEDIHCGLDLWTHDGIGASIAFRSWNLVSTFLIGLICVRLNGKVCLPQRYPLWHRVVRLSSCA